MTQISSSRDDRVVLRAEALGHRYGDNVALGHINFTVCKGEIVCVVGPSGVGKTTMLRCLAGLQRPTSGTVTCAGHPVESPPKEMAVVFQDYSRSLMPWLRVTANITLALSNEKIGRARKKEMAAEVLATVGLEGVGSSYPWQLSGGMQQRVAIARALVGRPAIVLMDEPFASVDAQTRADLEDMVIDLRARLGVTVLLVTHDIDEAVYLGDRVVVLSGKPATVEEIIDVDLGEHRDQIQTKSKTLFAELRAEVLKLIHPSASDAARTSSAP